MRHCVGCDQVAEFYENGGRFCKECVKARMREQYHAGDEEERRLRRLQRVTRQHGISPEWYADTLEDQGHGCAICQSPDPGRDAVFHIDHDHSCCSGKFGCADCVRGLLCSSCNTGLGSFGDDSDLLAAAAAYVMSAERIFEKGK